MVGVPRSGGCHTCRRRKIRCDQERPHCKRCRTDTKHCEGYDRWATFINRTVAGLQKRDRLEEAIVPPIQSVGVIVARSANPTRPHNRSTASTGSSIAFAPVISSESSFPDTKRSLATPVLDRGLISRFLDIYLPVSAPDRAGCAGLIWLTEACRLAEPLPFLRLALTCLAASRVAYVENNAALGKQSLQWYGEALKSLQQILSVPGTPKSKANDQVLVACRCLMIFEIFGPAGTSPKAWESHGKGLIQLAAMRGPDDFSSPSSTAILSDIRCLDMVACLHELTAPAFSSQRWRLQGKPTTVRQTQHRLNDLVLDLVDLYAEEESAKAAGNLGTTEIRSLLWRVDDFAAQFDDTVRLLLDLSPKARDKKYGDLNSAVFHAWCLVLLLEVSLWVHDYLDRLATGQIGPSSQPSRGLAPFIERQGDEWNDRMCRQAVDAIEYAIGDDMGFYGAVVAIFPIMMLLGLLPHDHPANADAAYLYGRLVTQKGVNNALDYPMPKGRGAADIEFWRRVDAVADPNH